MSCGCIGEDMKIDIEFKGLEELVKAFESAASDEDIAQVNKTIAEKGEPVVQRIMSGKIPKSKDIKKSGRGFGSKSSVSAHAADEIPIGKVKVNGTGATADVGWEKNTQDISTSVLLTGERFTDRHKSSYMQQAGRQMQNCKR